jgi:hypothetical protein
MNAGTTKPDVRTWAPPIVLFSHRNGVTNPQKNTYAFFSSSPSVFPQAKTSSVVLSQPEMGSTLRDNTNAGPWFGDSTLQAPGAKMQF